MKEASSSTRRRLLQNKRPPMRWAVERAIGASRVRLNECLFLKSTSAERRGPCRRATRWRCCAVGVVRLRVTVWLRSVGWRCSDGRYWAVGIGSGRGAAAREPMRSGIVGEVSARIRLTMLDATDLRRWAERCYKASRTCFDLSAATELRVLGDELTARATEVERAASASCERPR